MFSFDKITLFYLLLFKKYTYNVITSSYYFDINCFNWLFSSRTRDKFSASAYLKLYNNNIIFLVENICICKNIKYIGLYMFKIIWTCNYSIYF